MIGRDVGRILGCSKTVGYLGLRRDRSSEGRSPATGFGPAAAERGGNSRLPLADPPVGFAIGGFGIGGFAGGAFRLPAPPSAAGVTATVPPLGGGRTDLAAALGAAGFFATSPFLAMTGAGATGSGGLTAGGRPTFGLTTKGFGPGLLPATGVPSAARFGPDPGGGMGVFPAGLAAA